MQIPALTRQGMTTFVFAAILLTIGCESVLAQTTTFPYQGKLTDGGSPATGNYDFQFTLWDALSGGTQQPQPSPITVALNSVPVSGGVFTVQLDFGAGAFPGANRWLEISARPVGAGSFTTLSPRQAITSTPYAVRSASAGSADTAATATNATQLAGLGASQYVLISDSRLSDARAPTAGSMNYIQNTTTQQAGSNFNISGSGTVGGNLIANGNVGIGVGANNPAARLQVNSGDILFINKWRTETTTVNSPAVEGPPNLIGGFLGNFSGNLLPGNRVTPGVVGAFIGGGGYNGTITLPIGTISSGDLTNRVTDWFGTVAGGWANLAGNDNGALGDAFFATVSGGLFNTAGGEASTVGGGQTNNASGSWATIPGGFFNVAAGSNSFAAGTRGQANHDGTFVWGDFSTNQPFSSTGTNQFLIRAAGGVGIGTTAPTGSLDVLAPSGKDVLLGGGANTGSEIKFTNSGTAHFSIYNSGNSKLTFATTSNNISHNDAGTPRMVITSTGNVGIGTTSPAAGAQLQVALQTRTNTLLIENFVGGVGSIGLCTTGSGANANLVGTCSSSLRYKTNVQAFGGGLNIINRLRPISFDWKQNGVHDVGLAAEEVESVAPVLTFRNDKGEIEGVKYSQLSVVLINAIKEQQAQIEKQQKQIDELKKVACRSRRTARVCR